MFIKCLPVVCATALGLCAGAAQAATVNVTRQLASSSFGAENLQQTVTISTPNDPTFAEGGMYDGRAPSGMFKLTGDNGFGDFDAFCVELSQALLAAASYETPAPLYGQDRIALLDRLYTSVFADVDTAVEAAAFQISVWEIVHEQAATLDLTAGDVQFSNNAAVLQKGAEYISGLETALGGGYEIIFLQSPVSQNVVTARLRSQAENTPPVPLPATGLFLVSGIGGLVVLQRRRRKS